MSRRHEKRGKIRQNYSLFVLLKLKREKVSVCRDVTTGSAREVRGNYLTMPFKTAIADDSSVSLDLAFRHHFNQFFWCIRCSHICILIKHSSNGNSQRIEYDIINDFNNSENIELHACDISWFITHNMYYGNSREIVYVRIYCRRVTVSCAWPIFRRRLGEIIIRIRIKRLLAGEKV